MTLSFPSALSQKTVWRAFIVLVLLMSLDTVEGAGVLSTLFPMLQESLHFSLGSLGILSAINKIAGAFCAPLWVWLAGRTSRKRVLIICGGLWSSWAIGLAFSTSKPMFFILYSGLSLGLGGAASLASLMAITLFPASQRGRIVGLNFAIVSLVSAALSPMLGMLSQYPAGWRLAFMGLGCLTLVLSILVWKYIPDVSPTIRVPIKDDGFSKKKPEISFSFASFLHHDPSEDTIRSPSARRIWCRFSRA